MSPIEPSLRLRAASLLTLLALSCGESQPTPGPDTLASAPSTGSATLPLGSANATTASAGAATTGAGAGPETSAGGGAPSASPTSSAAAPPSSTVAPPSSSATATAVASGTTTVAPAPWPSASPAPTVAPVPTNLPPAKAGTANAVAADIDAVFADRTRFVAKFHQKHKQKVAGVEREQKGTVFVERPGRISFRYDAPNKNRIVSDGTTLRVYVAEDEQMFEHPVKNTEYPGAFSFIMGEGVRKSFDFTFNDKAKFALGPVIFGTPRSPQPGYESVQFYVDKSKLEKKDPGAVAGVLVLDAQGNKNRFELSEAKFVDKIDPNEFSFSPPAGTSVIK